MFINNYISWEKSREEIQIRLLTLITSEVSGQERCVEMMNFPLQILHYKDKKVCSYKLENIKYLFFHLSVMDASAFPIDT